MSAISDQSAGNIADPWQWRWGASFVVVISAHVGALALLIGLHGVVPPPPQAPIAIELAPFTGAPSAKADDRPPGPEQVRALSSAAATPEPTPPEKDSAEDNKTRVKDAVIAAAAPVMLRMPLIAPKKPKLHRKPVQPPAPTVAPEVSTASASVEATTAPPAMSASPAPSVSAPAAGVAHYVAASTTADWHSRLLAHLEKNLKYPALAQTRRQNGVVYVQFVMDRRGMVLNSAVRQPSGYRVLDQEALATLERAQPLPPPPEMSAEKIEMVVPLQFILK